MRQLEINFRGNYEKYVLFYFFSIASPCFSNIFGGDSAIHQESKTGEMNNNSFLVGERYYYGEHRPFNPQPSLSANLHARVKAPNGRAEHYTPTTGKGYFEYSISNTNSGPITCIVTKEVCMNNNDKNACVSFEQTFVIPRKNQVRDHGSYLSNTYTYMFKGTAYTTSTLYIDGCGNYSDHVSDRGHYQVS